MTSNVNGIGVAVPERLGYIWRLLATAMCFAVFGLGGMVLLVLIFPLLRLLTWNRQRRIKLARAVVRRTFRLFVALMQSAGVLRLQVLGLERLNRNGLLILANHPTLIDTVFLMAFVRHADCIVKADLKKNLFTRAAVSTAGYILNNHGDALIQDCINSLQCGNNLIVFPEGTRTASHDQMHFKRGAAHIAVRAKCNVTPVFITCWPKTLGKHEKWWHIPASVANFRIDVHEDINVAPLIDDCRSEVLAARHLTAYLQHYFGSKN